MEKICPCGEELIVHDTGATYCTRCGATTDAIKSASIIRFDRPSRKPGISSAGKNQQKAKFNRDRDNYVPRKNAR